MTRDFHALTIADAAKALRKKEFSAVELTDAIVAKAKKENPSINAYAEIFDDARTHAEDADRAIAKGDAPLLTGIPISIKDNMLYRGKESTSGSKILRGHIATYNGTAVERLRAHGAVIIGRTNMDEFAMGSSSESCAYGPVKNPIDTTRVPGGSSGGAAASVVMGGALGALGSDTGGSIRQPASFCGLVGLKPTYGTVSRYGLMALASSFDQIGPLVKTVADAQIIFDAVRGHDPFDATSFPDALVAQKKVTHKKSLVIGVPEDLIATPGLDKDVRALFEKRLEALTSAGHTIKNISLPSLAHALAVYYIIMPAEASANLARFDGIRYGFSKDADKLLDVYMHSRGIGFGKEARRRVLLGTYVLSAGYYDAYYNKAALVRRMISDELAHAMKDVDVIATPTAPSPAFRIGEKTSDPLKMYLEDIFTVSANIAGVPALSVPSGVVSRDGVLLPVGIQFMAAAFHEATLFQIGTALEETL